MRRAAILLASLFLLWANTAKADISCQPQYTALHTLEPLSDQPAQYRYRLNFSDGDPTKVVLDADYAAGPDGELNLSVHFDDDFDGVSLPYNIYSMLVINAGEVVQYWDFTDGCKGPGIGFFPGSVIDLPTLKLGSPADSELQIIVWGGI